MAMLPDEDALRAAARGARSPSADAEGAVVRTRVARLRGADSLAEQRAIHHLVRATDAYPLHDDCAALAWKCEMTSQAVDLASSSEEDAAWNVQGVIEKVEALARSRAQAEEQRRHEVDAAREQRRLAAEAAREQQRRDAEAARARALVEDRVAADRWLAVVQGLGMRDLEEARVYWRDDLEHAERALGVLRAEQAQRDDLARRRRKGRFFSIGAGIGVFALAGRFMRTEPEPFNVGIGACAGVAAGLIAYAWSDSLVEDAGEIARGAAMVNGLGGFARRLA